MKIKNAFTLVEMIVVVGMVIVLSVISVPICVKHQQKAAYTEGYVLIAAIRDAQLAYRAEYGNFLKAGDGSGRGQIAGWTCHETVLGINARGNKYFTCFSIGAWGTVKYSITGNIIKPKFLRKNSNDPYLYFVYNLTGMSTMYEAVNPY